MVLPESPYGVLVIRSHAVPFDAVVLHLSRRTGLEVPSLLFDGVLESVVGLLQLVDPMVGVSCVVSSGSLSHSLTVSHSISLVTDLDDSGLELIDESVLVRGKVGELPVSFFSKNGLLFLMMGVRPTELSFQSLYLIVQIPSHFKMSSFSVADSPSILLPVPSVQSLKLVDVALRVHL